MKRKILALAFLLVLAAAVALAQTPSNSQSNTQNNVAGNISGNAIPKNTAPAAPQSSTANSDMTIAATDSATLKGQLENAYRGEPTLTGSNIQVNVTDTTVEVSGSVPTGKEKTTAKRIAQSYAGNRKVVDKMTVSGRGNAAPNPGPTGEANTK